MDYYAGVRLKGGEENELHSCPTFPPYPMNDALSMLLTS